MYLYFYSDTPFPLAFTNSQQSEEDIGGGASQAPEPGTWGDDQPEVGRCLLMLYATITE